MMILFRSTDLVFMQQMTEKYNGRPSIQANQDTLFEA